MVSGIRVILYKAFDPASYISVNPKVGWALLVSLSINLSIHHISIIPVRVSTTSPA